MLEQPRRDALNALIQKIRDRAWHFDLRTGFPRHVDKVESLKKLIDEFNLFSLPFFVVGVDDHGFIHITLLASPTSTSLHVVPTYVQHHANFIWRLEPNGIITRIKSRF